MTADIITVEDTQGQILSIAGGSYRVLITGKETGGAYAVIEMTVPPGGGPGPHAHKDIQEMFYVVEGTVEFRTEGAQFEAGVGSFVNIPLGGKVHMFKNKSKETAKLLCTVVPAGLEDFFKEIGTAPQGPESVMAIGEKYGQAFYPPDFLGA